MKEKVRSADRSREHETGGEASVQGRVLRDVIAHVTGDLAIGKKIKNGELRKQVGNNEPPWKCPDPFTMSIIATQHFSMELLEPKENRNDDKIILQLHGGGYIGGMRNAYRMFAGLYSEVSRGMSVLTPDYRVAPEDPYPAALEDAYISYCYLLDQGWFSEQIILAGDSAGGGLAMALCHYLKDRGKQLPCGLIAMSPWTDMTASGESYVTNFERDPLFGNSYDTLVQNRDYIGDNDPMNAYISPLFGDFREFPPMLIQVGSYEMLLSDSMSVAAKAREQGVKVKLSVYDGMFHIFQMAAKMLPESRQAWVEIGKFIHSISK
jgi:acetyl esterase/lipase